MKYAHAYTATLTPTDYSTIIDASIYMLFACIGELLGGTTFVLP